MSALQAFGVVLAVSHAVALIVGIIIGVHMPHGGGGA